MARKTVADLEAENKALREEMANQPDISELEAENQALVDQAELLKAKQAQLVNDIENMEKPVVVNGQVQAEGCKIFTGNGYTENLQERGIKVVSRFDVETLRTFINSDWSPSMVMEKFGLTKEKLQGYVWRLSEAELRGDKPIRLDFKRDLFGREG